MREIHLKIARVASPCDKVKNGNYFNLNHFLISSRNKVSNMASIAMQKFRSSSIMDSFMVSSSHAPQPNSQKKSSASKRDRAFSLL
ncbi:hypothetical protein LS72_004590 [Helicobacter apodemus]|uniref:Uncharacterized protein n=1 Tax=Helicobacter apodemus TaxID=135569 RepID=A0A4U8UFJ9_9HELI|nr:hypothetical protein [Helicobacter apodemus]TLE16013.1 hypothetical protein LS72_004590 [Helicobacter apodemus]